MGPQLPKAKKRRVCSFLLPGPAAAAAAANLLGCSPANPLTPLSLPAHPRPRLYRCWNMSSSICRHYRCRKCMKSRTCTATRVRDSKRCTCCFHSCTWVFCCLQACIAGLTKPASRTGRSSRTIPICVCVHAGAGPLRGSCSRAVARHCVESRTHTPAAPALHAAHSSSARVPPPTLCSHAGGCGGTDRVLDHRLHRRPHQVLEEAAGWRRVCQTLQGEATPGGVASQGSKRRPASL